MEEKLKISSIACDYTGFHGTLGSRQEWLARAEKYTNILHNNFFRYPDTYIFGVRYCEMMYDEISQKKHVQNELEYRMRLSEQQGLKIAFSIPQLHEHRLLEWQQFYNIFLKPKFASSLINEIIVNDFGTLVFLYKNGVFGSKVTLGRSFDKTLRENRIDITTIDKIGSNQKMIETPPVSEAFYQELCKEYDVSGAELDSLPDGCLSLPKMDHFTWSIIYPKIVISKSSYCELGSAFRNNRKFTLDECGKTCRVIYKSFYQENGRILFITENTVCCKQVKPLEESVHGKVRLVYSEIL